MELKNGTILQNGKYKIVRFIGNGGFGCTYEAEHVMFGKRVAIKEFFVKNYCVRDEETGCVSVASEMTADIVGKLRKKFVDEAQVVFEMRHPGIVRVIDIFEENGTAYYVMNYIEGKSLAGLLTERGSLPEDEVLGYIHQVADALEYVHSLDRLHLDIKPGNIMLDSNGNVILIDFGASKHYDAETGENTTTLMGVNTPGFAPIEQVDRCFTKFNPPADIYALGATLYKLLTGITPPTSVSLVNESATLKPLPQNISDATRNAIKAAMQSKAKDRPQTIAELRKLLPKNIGNEPNPIFSGKFAVLLGVIAVLLLSVVLFFWLNGNGGGSEDIVVDSITDERRMTDIVESDDVDSMLVSDDEIGDLDVSSVSENNDSSNPGSHIITPPIPIIDSGTNSDNKNHIYVDLGLSVKWASCNVGAGSPSGHGDYFAWGELNSPSGNNYIGSACRLAGESFTGIGGNPEYDVATKRWGDGWRMPTKDEFVELKNNCDWTWTTKNGVKGYEVVSRSNGNSIFLPVTGYRYELSLKEAGTNGYYWSSTPGQSGESYAYCLFFHDENISWKRVYRESGLSVRPVHK